MDELPSRSSSERNDLVKTKLFEIDNNIAAALSYVPFCPANIIFSGMWMVTEPKSNKFLRYHAIQSLAINVGFIALWVVTGVLGLIPIIGFFAGLLGFIASLAYLGGNIYLMYMAYKGRAVTIPYISAIAEQNA